MSEDGRIRVAVVGRSYTLGITREKWNHVPEDVALAFVTPPRLSHPLGMYSVEVSDRWPHEVVNGYLTDRLSGFFLSPLPLRRALRKHRPHLVQVDQEPSSLALLEVLLWKRSLGCRVVFFTWENLALRYPPPFGAVRRLALRLADGAVAGTSDAARVLRAAGFQKPIATIPQLGVDPERFRPREELRRSAGEKTFTVGYVGRLIPEKGLLLLLAALFELEAPWHWLVVGRGPLREEIAARARERGVAERITWVDTVPHEEVPRHLQSMDVLVLPSQSSRRWKEQFGHVLVEAMACGVPVLGSDSGAIPEVVGDAGLVFAEGSRGELLRSLTRLSRDPALRRSLGERGRKRVLAHYTNEKLAEATVAFWREILARR